MRQTEVGVQKFRLQLRARRMRRGFPTGLGSSLEVGSGKLKNERRLHRVDKTGGPPVQRREAAEAAAWTSPGSSSLRAAPRALRSLWRTPLESAGVTFWMRL